MARSKDTVLTFNEAAEYLLIRRPAAYKLVREGKSPGQEAGRRCWSHEVATDRWRGDWETKDSVRQEPE